METVLIGVLTAALFAVVGMRVDGIADGLHQLSARVDTHLRQHDQSV
ncbi:MAG: hypothetical protein ACRDU8_09570 [Egibacteraceae bacterium]